MKIQKLRKVKTPTRGTSLSAGCDFYVPHNEEKFVEDLRNLNGDIFITDKEIVLKPHQKVLIPSGIRAEIPKNTVWIVFNKSGISSKKGLDVLACVIDEDYRGEININLVNTSEKPVSIFFESKIIQLLLLPILYEPIEVVDEISTETERGEGGFGHTGYK